VIYFTNQASYWTRSPGLGLLFAGPLQAQCCANDSWYKGLKKHISSQADWLCYTQFTLKNIEEIELSSGKDVDINYAAETLRGILDKAKG